ncbi:hypothetical protein AHF37_12394 [Paragonimus kellicotti]|nr:hypothetical protein AHF37_12394 [Paragonimus kellicotti]
MKVCKKANPCLPIPPTQVTSQILVKQQLNAHYQKVQNARATIDNKTPYSYFNNPTTRGYKKNPKPYRRASLSEYYSACEANFSVPLVLANTPMGSPSRYDAGNHWPVAGGVRALKMIASEVAASDMTVKIKIEYQFY